MADGVTDNTSAIKNAKEQALARAAEIIGGMAESYAKQYLTEQHAVDTGNLRNSITHEYRKEDHTVIVGTAVEYAPYVELGTVKMSARPYLHPAIEKHLDEYKEVIETELQGR